jgi:hypothetical protein
MPCPETQKQRPDKTTQIQTWGKIQIQRDRGMA